MQHETLYSQSAAESAETADHLLSGAVETADLTDETVGSVSPASALAKQPQASLRPGEDRAEPAEAELVPTFLHEIARTMHAAADRERQRITAEIADRLGAHVERVRFHASTEAEELKRLAEEDVAHIREWSAEGVERLRRETESRIGARREDLERHLRQHDDLVEREISVATEAVEEYQAELDRFVGRLAGEREPTEIARLASLVPEPPSVEEIASAARADAIAQLSRSDAASDVASAGAATPPSWPSSTTERGFDLVGVMDPSVVSQSAGQNAEKSAPAQVANISSQDEQVGQARQGRGLGARNRADLVIRLVPVLLLAVIIAIVVLLVMTGQAHAASSRSLASGI
jgi:hypothetical protein